MIPTKKMEEFQCQIRQKNRDKHKSQVRRIKNQHNRIIDITTKLIESRQKHIISDSIDQLHDILNEIEISQISPTATKSLFPLVNQYITQIIQQGLPKNTIKKCKQILCLFTQSHIITSHFSEDSLLVLIYQITTSYLLPDTLFYQCLLALANLLSCSLQFPDTCTYTLLEINGIQDVLCSILSIRNGQLDDSLILQSKYFSTDDAQDVFIWFLFKYFKLKENHSKLIHQTLQDQFEHYINCQLKYLSEKENIKSSFDSSIYKNIANIIGCSSILFNNTIRNTLKSSIICLIDKNIELQASSIMWKAITSCKQWDLEEFEIIAQMILQEVAEGQHPITSKRDKNYLFGFIHYFQRIDEETALGIWSEFRKSDCYDRIWERTQLRSKMETIQQLISKLRTIIDYQKIE